MQRIMEKDVLKRKLQFLESRYDSQEHELLDDCPFSPIVGGSIKVGSIACRSCFCFEGVTFNSDYLIRVACSH